MRVRKPSTCGWIVIDRRDFTVPMYSVVSSTGLVASVTTSTAIGGMPPGGAPAPAPSGDDRPQAESRQANATANERGDDKVNADIPATPARGRGARAAANSTGLEFEGG